MSGEIQIVQFHTERIPFLDQLMELKRLIPEQSGHQAALSQIAVEYLERFSRPAIIVPAEGMVAVGKEEGR